MSRSTVQLAASGLGASGANIARLSPKNCGVIALPRDRMRWRRSSVMKTASSSWLCGRGAAPLATEDGGADPHEAAIAADVVKGKAVQVEPVAPGHRARGEIGRIAKRQKFGLEFGGEHVAVGE